MSNTPVPPFTIWIVEPPGPGAVVNTDAGVVKNPSRRSTAESGVVKKPLSLAMT
jgi:hypothetical protein